MDVDGVYEKVTRSCRAAVHEHATLRRLEGPGIVPLAGGGQAPPPRMSDRPGPPVVRTRRGAGSLADVVAERGVLPEAECRGVGVAVARALAHIHSRGWVHGDVKPANVLVAPDTTVWLADFDAAAPTGHPRRRGTPGRGARPGPLHPAQDLHALGVLMAECATGVVIDPAVPWPAKSLAFLGVPARLAADLAALLSHPCTADTAIGLLDRGITRLPRPPTVNVGSDPTPTIDVETTAIEGLSAASRRGDPD